jgi:hypothetical protein
MMLEVLKSPKLSMNPESQPLEAMVVMVATTLRTRILLSTPLRAVAGDLLVERGPLADEVFEKMRRSSCPLSRPSPASPLGRPS